MAALILASSLLWYAISRLNITDMTVTFFFTLALLGYRFWLDDGDKRRWLLVFYAAMALATLTKGLMGVVLPGGIAVLHLAFTRRWRLLPRLFSPLAIALYFAVTVPWFWAVCRANPDFFDFFFIREHFLRYLTTVHDRYEPVWFFVPIILAAFVPWTGMLWDAARAARQPQRRNFPGPVVCRALCLFLALPFKAHPLHSALYAARGCPDGGHAGDGRSSNLLPVYRPERPYPDSHCADRGFLAYVQL